MEKDLQQKKKPLDMDELEKMVKNKILREINKRLK